MLIKKLLGLFSLTIGCFLIFKELPETIDKIRYILNLILSKNPIGTSGYRFLLFHFTLYSIIIISIYLEIKLLLSKKN
ncbi:hypothetical protein T190611E02C_10056 [Tenacibaculum sp. 190524A05c]